MPAGATQNDCSIARFATGGQAYFAPVLSAHILLMHFGYGRSGFTVHNQHGVQHWGMLLWGLASKGRGIAPLWKNDVQRQRPLVHLHFM